VVHGNLLSRNGADLTSPSLAIPIQSYTLRRQIVKNKNGERGGDGTTPMNEAEREATVAGEQSRTEERLPSPDATLTDKKDLMQNASDLEKGKGGS